jgi:hypothetical protein
LSLEAQLQAKALVEVAELQIQMENGQGEVPPETQQILMVLLDDTRSLFARDPVLSKLIVSEKTTWDAFLPVAKIIHELQGLANRRAPRRKG